jgi:hypothetical protein
MQVYHEPTTFIKLVDFYELGIYVLPLWVAFHCGRTDLFGGRNTSAFKHAFWKNYTATNHCEVNDDDEDDDDDDDDKGKGKFVPVL